MQIAKVYQNITRTINENITVLEALSKLMENPFNSLIVASNDEKVVGIISIQDIAGATVPEQFQENINMADAMYKEGFFKEICQVVKNKLVSEVMRKNILTVTPDTHIMVIMADFLKNDCYMVPVVEGGKLLGIVTRTEIKRALAEAMDLLPPTIID